jgi:hypothetical protein
MHLLLFMPCAILGKSVNLQLQQAGTCRVDAIKGAAADAVWLSGGAAGWVLVMWLILIIAPRW